MHLPPLPPASGEPGTETAQRYLASAFDSVEAVFDVLATIRALRKAKGTLLKGRLPANEEDLLRAAIVFTGAGLDASLKRLIRDTLPSLLAVSRQAHDKFEAFAASKLGIGDLADSKSVARYLTSPDPRSRLIEDYVYELTGSSLQSADEVDRTAGALGIDARTLRERIRQLKDLFIARNQVSHELDLQRTEKRGDRARRPRAIERTKRLCHDGLEAGQLIINAAGGLLSDGAR